MTVSAVDEWHLGVWVTGLQGVPSLERVRHVARAEFEDISSSMRRLRAFGCYSLDGGLPGALDAINLMIEGMASSTMGQVNSSEFKVSLRILINQWLAQVTAVRSHFEWLETLYPAEDSTVDVSQMFRDLYGTEPAFRLVWELRNLSQHDQPISNYLSFRVQLDEQEVTRGNYYLEIARLAADNTGKAWKACFNLWPGVAEKIDLQDLFRDAYLASFTAAARYTFNFRDQLDSDARAVVAMANEGGGRGAVTLYQIVGGSEDPDLSLPITTLDLQREILDETWKALENARMFLLDPATASLENLPRFSNTPAHFVP